MSQHDFNIANQTFPSFRADLNDALQASATMSAGSSAPTTPYAYQLWFDTTTDTWKVRNSGNTAWISTITTDLATGNVGIGAPPNATFGSLLYVQGTPAANKPIVSAYSQGNSDNAGFALFNDSGNRGIWTTGSTMRFTRTYEGNSTADVTIDASGNLLVGKTSSTYSTTGVENRATGLITSVVNGADCMVLNRQTSDGSIVQFRKDNTTVGSIGTTASDLCITSNNVGFRMDGSNNHIIPVNDSLATRDAAIDLGYSGGRFKDLYLSGGVYLGGTGSANYLDDYEQGTYNPTLTASGGTITLSASTDTMSYTKIGRMVTICGRVIIGSVSGSPTGTVYFSLPFSVESGTEDSDYTAFQVYTYGVDLASGVVSTFGEAAGGSSSVGLLYQIDNGGWGGIGAGGYSAGDIIYMNGSYFTA